MAWTANLGGQIRHAEIRSGRTADAVTAQERAEDGEDDEDEDDDEDDA
jgi:hypothetical protein